MLCFKCNRQITNLKLAHGPRRGLLYFELPQVLQFV